MVPEKVWQLKFWGIIMGIQLYPHYLDNKKYLINSSSHIDDTMQIE